MSKRRMKLSKVDYRELLEARAWCHRNGMSGMRNWYDEMIGYYGERGSLPDEAYAGLEEAKQ